MYATVILNTKQAGIGNGLTYRVWDGAGVRVGQLVKVSLRRKMVEGIVIALQEEKPDGDFDIKEISDVLGDMPLLTAGQIAIAQWMAEYYVCPLRYALSVWLPGGEWSKLLPEKKEFLRIVSSFVRAQDDITRNDITRNDAIRGNTKILGKKQELLVEYLKGKDWVEWEMVKNELGIGKDVVKRMMERKLVEMKEEVARCFDSTHRILDGCSRGACAEPGRSTQHDTSKLVQCHLHDTVLSNPTLTPRQQAAFKAIKNDLRPTLLFGITGSGKTEIYAAMIRETILAGKSAILLLPEILLTENFIDRFQQLVQRESIAVIHSRLTQSKRRDLWRQCRAGNIRLVIGSRSALFSPLPDLGLIIIDEEHEWTYKNEQSPRYHAGKVAEYMSRHAERSEVSEGHEAKSKHVVGEILHHARGTSTAFDRAEARSHFAQHDEESYHTVKLLLGSATPSVESWYKATSGEYQLVELPERYGGALLPSVQIVDLAQVQLGKYYPLSPTLINAIRIRLEHHEQSVLFLNRRGFATSLLCMDCRYRFEDAETKLPYTVHYRGARPYLLSHHTGEQMVIPSQCPRCSSSTLREVGAGTQRIEKILEDLFPSARILRADADTLKSPEQMRTLLEKMKENRADILLGTQSVVKGLDLPNVTLAAVLLADVGLSLPHFRAGERVFQLLTQLTGRSGRAHSGAAQAQQPGEVIIQTFRPDAIEVQLAARHDVRGYLEREMLERQKAHFPPDSQLIRFVFAKPGAERISRDFIEKLKHTFGIHISRSPSLFGGGKIWYVFVRAKHEQEVLKNLPDFDGIVDRDPIDCL